MEPVNTNRMRVLVGCECSGVVREAFRALGHDAWSCDLKPAEDGSPFHFQCDLLDLLMTESMVGMGVRNGVWNLGIFHPDCPLFNNASAWAIPDPDFVRFPGVGYHQKLKPETLTGAARRAARDEAAEFFLSLWHCRIQRICIENPTGYMNTHPKMNGFKPQTIQPYQFGADASKATCLWLKNLPHLVPTQYVEPRMVDRKPRWANQTDSGQNKLSPGEQRATDRARTYPGIAKAMAQQWSNL
jgi:hypothetical protein